MSAVECQAGGHPGAFVAENGLLKKKTGRGEASFYEATVWSVCGLAALCPKCYGVEEVDGEYYVLLEDLCHGFLKPSVADLKMGRTSVGEDNSEERRRRRREEEAGTTMWELGVRFTGMVVYSPQEDKYHKYDKRWGYGLQERDFNSALLQFLGHPDPAVTAALLHDAISQVQQVLDWFLSQSSLRFYSSSLLFVYDGARPTHLRVRMIDFAHVLPMASPDGKDENYLFGVKELLARLRFLALTLTSSSSS
jgi:hypothetical protein